MKCCLVVIAIGLLGCPRADAQTPRIGPFVVDLRVNFPQFPSDSAQLAQSRGISQSDLPGAGRGLDAGAHLYVFKWRAITFGVGGVVMVGVSHSTPLVPATTSTVPAPSVGGKPVVIVGQAITEQFASVAPQISFNFGKGTGWSYISGGVGLSTWSTVPDTAQATLADVAKLKTINYGGGARWFSKKHVGFTFDVRFYAINPGIANGSFGISPRTTLVVIGAGASLR